MPIFNKSQIQNDLNITDSLQSSYLSRILAFVEAFLEVNGISFYTSTSSFTVETLAGYSEGRTIFPVKYFKQVESGKPLKIKSFSNPTYSKTLAATDYSLSKHRFKPNPIYYIELNEPIYTDYYLEIEAIWGFCDEADFQKYMAELDFEIFEFILESMNRFIVNTNLKNNGGNEITSSEIGKVKVTFKPSQTNSNKELKLSSKIQSIINKYSLK